MTKAEALLADRIAIHMHKNHPSIPFRFDLVDKIGRINGIKTKQLHGKWSKGYPDLFIMQPNSKYHGLFLELKATKTVHNTPHTQRQHAYHRVLRKRGYLAMFVCGYEETILKLEEYLRIL